MDVETYIRSIDAAVLARLVQRATGTATTPARLGEWSVTPLARATGGATAGLFRVSSVNRDEHSSGATSGPAWSLVVKLVRTPSGNVVPGIGLLPAGFGDSVSDYNYWRREPLFYGSGLAAQVAALGGGLRPPRTICQSEHAANDAVDVEHIWLWLEDVPGTLGTVWSPDRYVLAARHFGRFNGAYTEGKGKPIPDHAWLQPSRLRSWLERWKARGDLALDAPPATWNHPLVREAFPEPVLPRLQRLWDHRERFLDALDRLPQVLGHLDGNPGNLFSVPAADGNEETVAIDWSFVGRCAAGEEMGQLFRRVVSVHADQPGWTARLADPAPLREALLEGYCLGLEDVGCRVDPALVRFACVIHDALRWGFFVPALRLAQNERQPAPDAQGRAIQERLRQRAAITLSQLDLADEARAQLPSILS